MNVDRVKPRKKKGLVYEEIGVDTVTFTGDRVFLLKGVASCIFDLCNGRRTVEDIARIISETLRVDKKVVLEDTRECIEELVKVGVLDV